jgi:hypothetical protein
MRVAWDIMNIFIPGADIQFPTEIEFKNLGSDLPFETWLSF